jgi:hypothetical protein
MNAVSRYLASGGADYIMSPTYEERRLALAEKLKAGRVSLLEMAHTLGLPLGVMVGLLNGWMIDAAAKRETKH